MTSSVQNSGLADSSQRRDGLRSRHRAPAGRPPSDSSVARHVWDDEGGTCPPDSGGPSFRRVSSPDESPHDGDQSPKSDASPKSAGRSDEPAPRELVVLPFAEYSAVYPERLTALRERLQAEPTARSSRFLIVDATRVRRPGGLLLGLLHATAGKLLKEGRCLVLAGDLCGLVKVSRLSELCHVADSRESAIAWCREHD